MENVSDRRWSAVGSEVVDGCETELLLRELKEKSSAKVGKGVDVEGGVLDFCLCPLLEPNATDDPAVAEVE